MAFCNESVSITIGKKDTNIILDGVMIRHWSNDSCAITTHIKKNIPNKVWNNIKDDLIYMDFWGMMTDNGQWGMDGSTLSVTGFIKNYYSWNSSKLYPAKKYIYRWSAEKMAIGKLFIKLYKLSGLESKCAFMQLTN
jgi:hypothetical protein